MNDFNTNKDDSIIMNTPQISSNEINEFLNSLNEKERKSYNIAKSFLGSSFDILKCNVFLEYKKKRINKEVK
jgi:hypothetical protein